MKFFFAATLLLGAFLSADAACPNSCSGRGRCTNFKASFSSDVTKSPFEVLTGVNALGYDDTVAKPDSCTCFLEKEDNVDVFAFTNPDCSGYTCPTGAAYNALPHSDNNNDLVGTITECSNVGTCNRASGVCECQAGFSGKACHRRKCPNECSKRGKCLAQSEIVELIREMSTDLDWDSSTVTYTAWDAAVTYGCWCDTGYFGADCSRKECPSASDPMGGLGSESGKACSGRGSCDHNSGQCSCHSGFFGNDCSTQLVDTL